MPIMVLLVIAALARLNEYPAQISVEPFDHFIDNFGITLFSFRLLAPAVRGRESLPIEAGYADRS